MKQDFYEVTENGQIAPSVFKMTLAGDTSPITAPGQFVNIKIPEFYLRRPISICDWDDKSLTVIYKVVGDGTSALSRIKKGEKLDLLISLGNGYDISLSGDKPLLIGGGVGVPPLFGLCKKPRYARRTFLLRKNCRSATVKPACGGLPCGHFSAGLPPQFPAKLSPMRRLRRSGIRQSPLPPAAPHPSPE